MFDVFCLIVIIVLIMYCLADLCMRVRVMLFFVVGVLRVCVFTYKYYFMFPPTP